MYNFFIFYIYKVLFLHPLREHLPYMFDLQEKEKTENIQFSLICYLDLLILLHFKHVQF